MFKQSPVAHRGGAILLIAVIMLAVPRASLRADDNDPNHLNGAWALTIKPDPDVNVLLPEQVHVLGNFTQDGNFIFSDSLGKYGSALSAFGLPAPFTQSPGHGQWLRTAKGKFILDSWHVVFNNEGQFFGYSRGRAIVEFDPKKGTVTGTNYLELYTPDGKPLPGAGIPGKVTGYRLSIEPPPTQ
jgi:hypothetical protein